MTEAERKDLILKSYCKAADLAIAYFQKQDKYIANMTNSTPASKLPLFLY